LGILGYTAGSLNGTEGRDALIVVVPGAFLYPSDYACLATCLLQSSQQDGSLNLSVVVAAVDWNLLIKSDQEKISEHFDESIEAAIGLSESKGITLLSKKYERYSNVVVACHSMGTLAAFGFPFKKASGSVSYTHLRAHET